jgi:hypothetical protein
MSLALLIGLALVLALVHEGWLCTLFILVVSLAELRVPVHFDLRCARLGNELLLREVWLELSPVLLFHLSRSIKVWIHNLIMSHLLHVRHCLHLHRLHLHLLLLQLLLQHHIICLYSSALERLLHLRLIILD